MLLKIYSFLFTIAMILGLVYYAYDYYQTSQAKINELRERQTMYEMNLKSTQDVVSELEQQNQIIQEKTIKLQEKLEEAEKYQDELREKLQDHDLTRLSAKKPALIEKRINDATSKIFKELEVITSHSSLAVE